MTRNGACKLSAIAEHDDRVAGKGELKRAAVHPGDAAVSVPKQWKEADV